MHSINSSTFAIGLCALALFVTTTDKKFLPVAGVAGIVLVAARVADSRQKRTCSGSTDTN
jgi:membrane-bound metal-dependent hydrolase YbcI (DUF457 family)